MALNKFPILFEGDKERSSTLPNRSELAAGHNRYKDPQIFFSHLNQTIFRPMIGRPMSVNSSFDSHGSHNPNFPRDSSFDSRYQHQNNTRESLFQTIWSILDLKYFRRSGPDTGYYSDKNETRNGFRDERGYLSDHSSRYQFCEMFCNGRL